MGWFSSNKNNESNLLETKDENHLSQLWEDSTQQTVGFFKHSTRCSISSMALQRFIREMEKLKLDFPIYQINVIEQRPLSNQLENLSQITHQSPQFILVKDKKEIYNASHNAISLEEALQLNKK